MALFGKKKQDENKPAEQNAEASSGSKEMDIILQARQEEEEERKARNAAREAEQEKYKSKIASDMEKSATAAADVLQMFPARTGEQRFFMMVEANVYTTEPVIEGDEIVTGILRGKISKGMEIQVLSGLDSLNKVTVNAIWNDDRVMIDEASDERVEIELSKGDFKDAASPDEQNEARVMTYSILTNLPEEEGRSDGIRLPAMLCEFSRYQDEQEFIGQLMNAAMTTEFAIPAKVSGGSGSQRKVTFAGMRSENSGDLPMLPAFSSFQAFEKHKGVLAKTGGFNSAIKMDFAQLCSIARDDLHGGCVVDPMGPVIFALPKQALTTATKTVQFHALFGESKMAEKFVPKDTPEQPAQRVREYNVTSPIPGAEYNLVEAAVKKFGDTHADIAKMCIVMIVAADDPNEKAYVVIIDCPKEKYDMNSKIIERTVRPYLKAVRRIECRPFDKEKFTPEFFMRYPWTYNKLSM